MPPIEVSAPAKVNLTLHVTGQRADGYHLLDSLVAFADFGDQIRLIKGPDLRITVSGPFAEGVPTDHRNLVWRAAEIAGWTGQIHIEKNLPHGAGIGGGSSDAGAVLRALGHTAPALGLGADVPVCQHAGAARMAGIGEQITPVATMPPLQAILVNPGVHVPTPKVFSVLRQKDNDSMEALPAMGASPATWTEWLRRQRNDLEAPAMTTAPVIRDVLAALSRLKGVSLARMSGSGATCFALVPEDGAHIALARTLSATFPQWWVQAGTLT